MGFQSTPPCAGGDTRQFYRREETRVFQSTPPCAGGDRLIVYKVAIGSISIHAPLCGGRPERIPSLHLHADFNPRPPVRGATTITARFGYLTLFQSTPPCAGGDQPELLHNHTSKIFQSTPPCAGGDIQGNNQQTINFDFNPRPPVRGATAAAQQDKQHNYFNPRPPVRGATRQEQLARNNSEISIHAPLCGGRLGKSSLPVITVRFQSTPPCAGGDLK